MVDGLNSRLRENNLIVKGLPEQELETLDNKKVKFKLLFTHLITCASEIERAHRLGLRKPGFNKPIIIKFLNYKTKSEIVVIAQK